MKYATFRFYAGLNRFLEDVRRGSDSEYAFFGRPAVKDAIEALGVPHTQVALLLANDRPIDFTYHLSDGDRISVYPPFRSLEIEEHTLEPAMADPPRFVLDAHLGKLARYLRMLGLDARYRDDFDDATLARIADEEDRILLTRDRKLLHRSRVRRGHFVHETDPRLQIEEIMSRYELAEYMRPFSRCLRCNGLLRPVEEEAVQDQLPPDARKYFDEFFQCERCGHVYWKGSHYDRMSALVDELKAE